jgi:putative ABC transport system ATP-binding protein
VKDMGGMAGVEWGVNQLGGREQHRPVAVVAAIGVSRRYQTGDQVVHALDDVDLAVCPGEFVALMGRSGSGKSTLLHILGGVDRPDRGEVSLEGRAIAKMRDAELAALRRRRIGFVFQFFSLIPTLTVVENVAFPLTIDGAPNAMERARAALASVHLDHRERHRPALLSGGEQQRAAIARALVIQPAIVLADEPTGNLDSATGGEVLDLLQSAAEEGHTVIVATHDDSAAARADRVLRMSDGRLAG